MTHSIFSKISVIACILLSILAFQNCSKVGSSLISDDPSISQSVNETGMVSPVKSETQIDHMEVAAVATEENCDINPKEHSAQVAAGERSSVSDKDDDDDDDDDDNDMDHDKEVKSHEAHKSEETENRGSCKKKHTTPQQEVAHHDKCHRPDSREVRTEMGNQSVPTAAEITEVVKKARMLCDSKEKISAKPAVDLVVKNVTGGLQADALSVSSVKNVSGLVVLRGADANSKADLIKNIGLRGGHKSQQEDVLVLCNFKDITLIKNVRGMTVIVDSTVESIKNLDGDLYLVNSTVKKSIENLRGQLLKEK